MAEASASVGLLLATVLEIYQTIATLFDHISNTKKFVKALRYPS